MTEAPEPKDKLDAATAVADVVNGPEDANPDWRQVDWRRVEDDVRRLRQRIFTASQAGESGASARLRACGARLSRVLRKRARPVLRGVERRKALDLPDLSSSATADAPRLIGLHQARQTHASLMIAVGVNIRTISEWIGHSKVNMTVDRHGHLLPGPAQVALGLLDEFLAKKLR